MDADDDARIGRAKSYVSFPHPLKLSQVQGMSSGRTQTM